MNALGFSFKLIDFTLLTVCESADAFDAADVAAALLLFAADDAADTMFVYEDDGETFICLMVESFSLIVCTLEFLLYDGADEGDCSCAAGGNDSLMFVFAAAIDIDKDC